MKKMKLFLPLCLCASVVALVGCATKTDTTSHIWNIGGTGTKFGIVQDPATQQYSLGLQRVQIVNTIVPCRVITNNSGEQKFITPDVVVRYEVQGKNTYFGNAGLTETVATGTNAVNTQVGGQTPPINANISGVPASPAAPAAPAAPSPAKPQ